MLQEDRPRHQSKKAVLALARACRSGAFAPTKIVVIDSLSHIESLDACCLLRPIFGLWTHGLRPKHLSVRNEGASVKHHSWWSPNFLLQSSVAAWNQSSDSRLLLNEVLRRRNKCRDAASTSGKIGCHSVFHSNFAIFPSMGTYRSLKWGTDLPRLVQRGGKKTGFHRHLFLHQGTDENCGTSSPARILQRWAKHIEDCVWQMNNVPKIWLALWGFSNNCIVKHPQVQFCPPLTIAGVNCWRHLKVYGSDCFGFSRPDLRKPVDEANPWVRWVQAMGSCSSKSYANLGCWEEGTTWHMKKLMMPKQEVLVKSIRNYCDFWRQNCALARNLPIFVSVCRW